MSDVTRILGQIESGDPKVADQLLPLVYDELRKLAAAKLAREKPGQTLQATALVHEAYLRLVDVEEAQQWDSRGHFFAAAAVAMRRILVENARRKCREKRGGGLHRIDLDQAGVATTISPADVLALDDVVSKLAQLDATASQLVELRHFGGLSLAEAATVLGVSVATAYRQWAFARAWLHCELGDGDTPR